MEFDDLLNTMKTAQQELAAVTATGEAGAGDVRATVNGKHQLLKLEIATSLINPQDKTMLQDLIIAAINTAQQRVAEQLKTSLHDKMKGFMM